jgi:hypothetical protein
MLFCNVLQITYFGLYQDNTLGRKADMIYGLKLTLWIVCKFTYDYENIAPPSELDCMCVKCNLYEDFTLQLFSYQSI